MVRAETASLGTVVENEQVVQLPLNGRLFIMLATIAPGVALPPNSVLPRINGGRPRTNEYLFDGISVLQPEPGQVAYYPIVDAIQEFKIESNSPPAEFGRFNGGVVNLTTKSGANAFHGNVFEFFRNEHLNARNYFQQANPVKPEYRRNQYGGMVGGPLVQEPDVLLRRLSGPAPAHRPNRHVDRADRAAASGHLHRSRSAGRVTGHLRSGDHRRLDPIAVSQQHDSEERDGSRRARPRSIAIRCRPRPGTANNYSRTANEINDQDQGDVASRSQVRVRP